MRSLAARKHLRRHAVAKSSRGRAKASHPVEPPTVLIVDDDASALRSLNRLVSLAGFRVRTFERPAALLASDLPGRNVCLVVDVFMPEMNGVELCERLADSGRRLPAILITGRCEDEIRPLIERSRAVEVLYKPVDEEPLLRAIKRAVALSNKDETN